MIRYDRESLKWTLKMTAWSAYSLAHVTTGKNINEEIKTKLPTPNYMKQ